MLSSSEYFRVVEFDVSAVSSAVDVGFGLGGSLRIFPSRSSMGERLVRVRKYGAPRHCPAPNAASDRAAALKTLDTVDCCRCPSQFSSKCEIGVAVLAVLCPLVP